MVKFADQIFDSFLSVIPAKAGIHLEVFPRLKCKASTRPAGERMTFFACGRFQPVDATR